MNAEQSWFVYYKVPRDAEPAVTAQAKAAMRAASRGLPVSPRLMKKLDETDRVTLMEIYDGIGNAAEFRTALADALAASGMTQELIAARRVEVFSAIE